MPKRPLPDDNPPRQSTRMLRSKRPATAPTVMSLLATATAFLSPTEVPADAKHLPVEIIKRITLIIAARKDKATLLTLMRVGKTWNRTAAVHIYRTLDFGERDASAIIWGLDRTICWNLPWGEMDRSGHNIFGNGYLEERSPTKIAALSLVQHIVLRLDELHDVWGEWAVDQMSKADGLFGAVESLRIIQKTERKWRSFVQDITIPIASTDLGQPALPRRGITRPFSTIYPIGIRSQLSSPSLSSNGCIDPFRPKR